MQDCYKGIIYEGFFSHWWQLSLHPIWRWILGPNVAKSLPYEATWTDMAVVLMNALTCLVTTLSFSSGSPRPLPELAEGLPAEKMPIPVYDTHIKTHTHTHAQGRNHSKKSREGALHMMPYSENNEPKKINYSVPGLKIYFTYSLQLGNVTVKCHFFFQMKSYF